MIMGLMYKNKSYKIVIPPNNLHLEQFANKFLQQENTSD